MFKRKTVREQIEAKKSKKKKGNDLRFNNILIDIKRNPMIAFGLGGSALLTSLSGLFIGLAPSLDETGNLILFGGEKGLGSVAMGIFFGVLYMTVFPVIGELGVYYWHRKASLRDEDSQAQTIISFSMLVLTFLFMIVTAVSASFILASLLHTFSAFSAIPAWAQKWTILVIPFALAIHAGANMWYDHVSSYAEERRFMERELQTAEIEAENTIREARINARKQAALSMAEKYSEVSGVEAVALGHRKAKDAWKIDKREMSMDADEDGVPDFIDSEVKTSPAIPSHGNGQHP